MPIPPVTSENRAPWHLHHMPLEKPKLVKVKRTRQNLSASLRDWGLATLTGGDLGSVISGGQSQMSE